MKSLPRREFLRVGTASAAGLAVASCHEEKKSDPYALRKPAVPGTAGWHRGEEKWILSACGQCHAGCGIRVRVMEGRAIKVEGNREFPINQGGIGPKGQAGLEILYHPNRVAGPLKRDGERGSGKFKPIPWDQAIAEVGAVLKGLRDKGQAHTLVVMDGDPRGVMMDLWARFAAAFGTPNHLGHQGSTLGAKALAMQAMMGHPDVPAHDWASARYVLGLGAGLLESWCQTMHLMRASSNLRVGMPGRRVKFVTVSTRFSASAMKADEWVPVAPATEGALALGLCHVLWKKGLHDKDFVTKHSVGFDAGKDAQGLEQPGFKDVLAAFTPQKVEELTGVDAATVERLAMELHENRPSLVVSDDHVGASTNGLGTAMAIQALNAMLGNLEDAGGVMAAPQVGLAPWPAVAPDEVGHQGLSMARLDGARTSAAPMALERAHALPAAMLKGDPYAANAMFFYKSNPMFSKPDGAAWMEALKKVTTVVSFSPIQDESTLWADYVLPDHTYLERFDVVVPAPAAGTAAVTWRQPVVPPQLNTRHTGDVILQLAKTVGGPLAAALDWEDYRAAVNMRLEGLLNRSGASAQVEDLEALQGDMETQGGFWLDQGAFPSLDKAFPTPSRKFEFRSSLVADRVKKSWGQGVVLDSALKQKKVTIPAGWLALPHWEPPHFEGDPAAYPLALLPYRAINHAEGGVRHLPLLVELPLHRGNPYRSWVELHPQDGALFNLKEGMEVNVESPAGRQRMRVRLHEGVRVGTAAVAVGHGNWPPKPGDSPTGVMPLLVNHSDPLAGSLAINGTRVRVVRA